MTRRCSLLVLAAVAALCLTGCSPYTGINSLSLPGDVGTGRGSYQVLVQLANAANLVPNTPVLVDDINVGTVTDVALKDGTPTLTLSLLDSVRLPANAIAKLGQTSLLGSKHVELQAPPDEPAEGTLRPGAVIGGDRTHVYPQTEDLLASVSLLLNGGGLQHVQTITTELNHALGGRQSQVRDLLTQLNGLTSGLDAQKDDIVSALHGLDLLGGTLAPRMARIDTALQSLPAGLRTLGEEEPDLRGALDKLSGATRSLAPFSDGGVDQLSGVLDDMRPVLRGIGDTQPGSMIQTLKMAPFVVFPMDQIPYSFRGDYLNITITLDLTNEALDKAFLGGTPGAGLLAQGDKVLQGKGLPGVNAARPPRLPGPASGGPAPNGLLPKAPTAPGGAGAPLLPKVLPGNGG